MEVYCVFKVNKEPMEDDSLQEIYEAEGVAKDFVERCNARDPYNNYYVQQWAVQG